MNKLYGSYWYEQKKNSQQDPYNIRNLVITNKIETINCSHVIQDWNFRLSKLIFQQ